MSDCTTGFYKIEILMPNPKGKGEEKRGGGEEEEEEEE